ncbi:MAG: alpha/beta hydrolase [Spirochaetaceae bacterium]|jgi:pimeloyl-ACP methyl ester carboxylesterase|nr:alpha/beta hydrolase [Spirochaetaceae bacterium]
MIPSIYEKQFLPCAGLEKLGTILFLHGFGGTYQDNFSAAALTRHFDYHAINLPGHGDNANKITRFDSSLYEYAQYIINYIERSDMRDLTLIGHSLGGAVAGVAESKIRGRLSNLILINPLSQSITGVPGLEKIFFPDTIDEVYDLCRYAYHNFDAEKMPPSFNEACQKTLCFQLDRREYLYGLYKMLVSPETIELAEESIKNLKTRTLYIMGQYDRIVPITRPRQLISGNKNIEEHIFEYSGHCPHNEESESFAACIEDFVRRGKDSGLSACSPPPFP